MTRKSLIWTLLAAGLIVAASSAALNIYSPRWFAKDGQVSLSSGGEAGVVSAPNSAAAPAPALPVPAGTTPNYRAIVEQAGPAVVGVNVAGLRKLGAKVEATSRFADHHRFSQHLQKLIDR